MLSYIAALITCLGIYLVGKKNKYGFIVLCCNESLWAYIAITTPEVRGLLLIVGVAVVIHYKSFRKWCEDERKTTRKNG